ncbi:MAG: ADP-ribosylglycohydrolase family protein [Bacteroidales bacterium]|nr:ADP-ribosylglycohydrolase family protein [Bacteroidales bacterium]
MEDLQDKIKAAILGLVVGDALGVPVEFKSRAYLSDYPVEDMMGYGTYYQPPGTWSDDSSMTFCTMQALLNGYDLDNTAALFLNWMENAYWTAHDERFDIGITASESLYRYKSSKDAYNSGSKDEMSNGNGSLMRIMPMAFFTLKSSVDERFQMIKEVSAITHGHIRSALACYYYVEFAIDLIQGNDKFDAYKSANNKFKEFIKNHQEYKNQIFHFDRLLNGEIHHLPEENVHSSGYVLHSLEASIWCLLNSNSYKETVLKAVNLGEDTDTTAAIAGGIAGLAFGIDSIPELWLDRLARREDIEYLCERFADVC